MAGYGTTYIGYITYMTDDKNSKSKISAEARAKLAEMSPARRELFERIIEAQGPAPEQD